MQGADETGVKTVSTGSTTSLVGYTLRVCCMYTVINLFLVLLSLRVPALRGFAVCNTMFILVLTFVMKIVDPAGSVRPFHTFGMHDSALIAFSDFTNHVLPLFLIYEWASRITVFTAVLPPLVGLMYNVIASVRWVYGAAFEVQPPRVVLCALACYAMLVLGVTLTRRLGVRYGIVFLVACMTVIYLFAYVSWTATPRASALSSG